MEKIVRFFEARRVYELWVLNGLFFLLAYVIPNRAAIFEARELPFFAFEKLIPFVLITTPLYLSSFIQLPLALAIAPKNIRGIFFTVVAMLFLFNGAVFLLFPTTFHRPLINDAVTGFSGWLYSLTIAIDTPRNCFPSQHVAAAALASLVFLKERKLWGVVLLVWSLGIMISTLTTKQHYAVDILGGVFVAGIFYLLYLNLRARYTRSI